MGRTLMIIGALIFVLGAAVWFVSKAGIPLGRLPGDLSWEGRNVQVYIPFATMIIVSVILTIVLNVISRIGRK
jgi:heme/copper-type cytochrome/quinol oxidase subunit 2